MILPWELRLARDRAIGRSVFEVLASHRTPNLVVQAKPVWEATSVASHGPEMPTGGLSARQPVNERKRKDEPAMDGAKVRATCQRRSRKPSRIRSLIAMHCILRYKPTKVNDLTLQACNEIKHVINAQFVSYGCD